MADEKLRSRLEIFDWRYLPYGTVVHALRSGSGYADAECGTGILPASEWRGTGSQDEYDRAAGLRRCRRCIAVLKLPADQVAEIDRVDGRS